MNHDEYVGTDTTVYYDDEGEQHCEVNEDIGNNLHYGQ
jgi:hypothetical protein